MTDQLKYIIIDNVFDSPDMVLEITKELTFYSSRTKNPVNAHGDKWKGFRSEFLQQHQKQKIFVEVTHKILNTLNVYDFFAKEQSLFNINPNIQSVFHYTTEEFQFEDNDEWVHTDPAFLFSGVIYLQKDPPKNSGTILFYGNEEIVIENKFNRLIFYRSDIMHSSQSGFGQVLEDARLVLLFFIDSINLTLQKKHGV